jgi:F-type H+-transporting ATPase subunit epsilon
MAQLKFELVTPEALVRSEYVSMVTVPGVEGDFGAMAGMVPLLTMLRPNSELSLYAQESSVPTKLRVSSGFARMNESGLTILAEQVTAA